MASRRTRRCALALLAMMGAVACGSAGASQEVKVDAARAPVVADAIAPVVAGTDQFGLDLYHELGAAGTDNLVLSLYSIAVALAMARAGANGQTATEIDAVLHADPGVDLGAGFNGVSQALEERAGTFTRSDGSKDSVELSIANSLWGQRDYHFLDPFLRTLATQFGAGMRIVDYIADADASRQSINRWVDDQTSHKITDLLPEGSLDDTTRLVAVNAVYLKAGWAVPFDEDRTADAPFHPLDGSTVDVPLMSVTTGAGYATGDGWQAVELDYVGAQLSMLAIVPDEGAFAAFEQGLDSAQLDQITGALTPTQLQLQFPKFSFSTGESLRDALSALGMPTAFADADFSAITDELPPLYLSDVFHKALVIVDEKGTEAAAATGDVFSATGAPMTQPLVVDRPFVFLIRDKATGAPLFLGRVTDPRAGT